MITITVNVKGDTNMVNTMLASIKTKAKKGVNILAKQVKDIAVTDYWIQRQTKKPESLIVKSFFVIEPYDVGNGFWAHVVAGGPGQLPNPNPLAPYAPFVDEGHSYKNGKVFPGYHFMEHAIDEGEKIAESIISDEINK